MIQGWREFLGSFHQEANWLSKRATFHIYQSVQKDSRFFFIKARSLFFVVLQSCLLSVTQEARKHMLRLVRSSLQKLACFSKGEHTFCKASTYDHTLLGKRARLWKPDSFLHSKILWAGFYGKLTKSANHMWQMWKLARFENQGPLYVSCSE